MYNINYLIRFRNYYKHDILDSMSDFLSRMNAMLPEDSLYLFKHARFTPGKRRNKNFRFYEVNVYGYSSEESAMDDIEELFNEAEDEYDRLGGATGNIRLRAALYDEGVFLDAFILNLRD